MYVPLVNEFSFRRWTFYCKHKVIQYWLLYAGRNITYSCQAPAMKGILKPRPRYATNLTANAARAFLSLGQANGRC